MYIRQLAKNLSALSTSAPARSVRVEQSVFRRGTCDRDLEEAASVCGGRGVVYGISIDFRPESLARSGFCEKGSY
jgi:hypothetical protein